MSKIRAHVFVAGKVQGVYFRQNTMLTARQHGVVGWVRNLEDGRVEAILEGDEDNVRKVIDWCNHGPPSSKVHTVEVKYETCTGEFSDFDITD